MVRRRPGCGSISKGADRRLLEQCDERAEALREEPGRGRRLEIESTAQHEEAPGTHVGGPFSHMGLSTCNAYAAPETERVCSPSGAPTLADRAPRRRPKRCGGP